MNKLIVVTEPLSIAIQKVIKEIEEKATEDTLWLNGYEKGHVAFAIHLRDILHETD